VEGFPLGLFPDVSFDELTVQTQPGDVVVFISDGILDAENGHEEMYGQDRLASVLCEFGDRSATEIAEAILTDVTRFQGARERFDDETIIVLKVS
jgi:sigma-B regulation protein RsbU (phosphoserine phosphatase)